MALVLDRIKTHMEIFAGRATHMYLDAAGKVTVGIGNDLPDVASAQALVFLDRETGEQATPPQIAADFAAIQKQQTGLLPYEYEPHTKLDLPESEIDRLLDLRMQTEENELRSCYPEYDTFPESAQLALLDMIFSLGSADLQAKWPGSNSAISLRDWHKAALECTRAEALGLRNDSTRALFERAIGERPARTSVG